MCMCVSRLTGDETLLEARESINRVIDEQQQQQLQHHVVVKTDGVVSNRAGVGAGVPEAGVGKLANSTTIGIGSTLPQTAAAAAGGPPGSLKKSRSRHYIIGTLLLDEPLGFFPRSRQPHLHLPCLAKNVDLFI